MDGRAPEGQLDLESGTLASYLECPICLALFTDPIDTNCGHTFCALCAVNHVKLSQRCPLCREIINATASSFTLRTLVDAYRHQQKSSLSQPFTVQADGKSVAEVALSDYLEQHRESSPLMPSANRPRRKSAAVIVVLTFMLIYFVAIAAITGWTWE